MTEEERKRDQAAARQYWKERVEAEKRGEEFPHMLWASDVEKMRVSNFNIEENQT